MTQETLYLDFHESFTEAQVFGIELPVIFESIMIEYEYDYIYGNLHFHPGKLSLRAENGADVTTPFEIEIENLPVDIYTKILEQVERREKSYNGDDPHCDQEYVAQCRENWGGIWK